MLHIFWLSCIYCIDKLVTCESTIEMKHLIFLFKNVTTWRQILSVFRLIFRHFKISSNPFHIANSNQNEKKIEPLCLVCHGLPENAFQVNQLYKVTWSSMYTKNMYLSTYIKSMSVNDRAAGNPIGNPPSYHCAMQSAQGLLNRNLWPAIHSQWVKVHSEIQSFLTCFYLVRKKSWTF